MKTVPIRDLVRGPKEIRKMTNAGESVIVTIDGNPVWRLSPVDSGSGLPSADERLKALLKRFPKASKTTGAEIVKEGRE